MNIVIEGMDMPKPGVYTCELGVLDANTAILTIHTPICESQKSYKLVPLQAHSETIAAIRATEGADVQPASKLAFP